ncbi:MAG: PQQ-dependent sugar dehydrogenase [Chloroflexota bacterium]|nr:PQQ-dependent sugar dehydrogenase [Chloroflexota bacterium]
MPRHLRRRSIVLPLLLGLLAGLLPQAAAAAVPSLKSTVIASGLVHPWDVAFAPDGTMLVTERPGRVRVYSSGAVGAKLVRTIGIPAVQAQGEAGLMGIAVDVDFASNRFVYVCASRDTASGWRNQVLRYSVRADGNWGGVTVLIGSMIANTIHNGCALEMDRFGKLWVSMGDANDWTRAQNRNSLNGKILRINRDGTTPSDNPVIGGTRNAVYSMGHRNPQGIAIRPGTDQVYAAEHGPEPDHGDDEINRIVAGGNYGWPCFTGDGRAYRTIAGCTGASNYITPLWASGVPTLATSGAAFVSGSQWADFNGNLFVSTLKERDLRRFSINPAGTDLGGPATHFNNTWGRLRASVSGPGGQLYLTSSNGSDDKVIRISPAAPSVGRLAGADRYNTAAAVSRASYPGGATNVMVATGVNFPDALAGSAAAGHLGMPVLLVHPSFIPAATAAELDRLNPQRIYVVGGAAVVPESIRNGMVRYASSGQVIRVSGADRYATAAAISSRWYPAGPPAAFVATGANFADALAGAPAAALRDSPLLLVTQNAIPGPTSTELSRLKPQRIYVLGGTGVVSAAVAAQLDAYTVGPVTRLAGANRYVTGAAIVRAFWTRSATGYAATGTGFADALAGGAAAGRAGVPMLLVEGGSVPLPTGQEILRLGPRGLTILGGTGAVSSGAETALKRLLGTP